MDRSPGRVAASSWSPVLGRSELLLKEEGQEEEEERRKHTSPMALKRINKVDGEETKGRRGSTDLFLFAAGIN